MNFDPKAVCANLVAYRTYSRRKQNGSRESWDEIVARSVEGLVELGRLSEAEKQMVLDGMNDQSCLPAGRWLWVGGTDWLKHPKNYKGAYNCTSISMIDVDSFGFNMEFAMTGCGTGSNVETKFISKLQPVQYSLAVKVIGLAGERKPEDRLELTQVESHKDGILISIGDSRDGWVAAYKALISIAMGIDESQSLSSVYSTITLDDNGHIPVLIDISSIRPQGQAISGFGGVANPVRLVEMFVKLAKVLNRAKGRNLTSVEAWLLVNECSLTIVAGNIRRVAGMVQGNSDDLLFASAKDNLYSVDDQGNWKIDPDRDALRMSNATRVFHKIPSLGELVEAVDKQFKSGEGAIQFAPNAIVRANIDLLTTTELQQKFISLYVEDQAKAGDFLKELYYEINYKEMDSKELDHRINRYFLNPCGEIIGKDFHCNLSEVMLNVIDPFDFEKQEKAFKTATKIVASLLHHVFPEPRFQYSRQIDPIVGVACTGLFDFFVSLFGRHWLMWWSQGRGEYLLLDDQIDDRLQYVLSRVDIFPSPIILTNGQYNIGKYFHFIEKWYLKKWKKIVYDELSSYCTKHGLKIPNRYTTVQPSGTKSLLTNASPGWHPPKAQRFIRRVTFGKNDPVALACIDYGYSVIPSQSDKDEKGQLLNDPFDPRCTEWLVEIPVSVPYAEICDDINFNFPVESQWSFYTTVQEHWTTHNTSATLQIYENEIEILAELIYSNLIQGGSYISAAILSHNSYYPRLPFEPISKETYESLVAKVQKNRKDDDFYALLSKYDSFGAVLTGPAGCDSDKCLLPE